MSCGGARIQIQVYLNPKSIFFQLYIITSFNLLIFCGACQEIRSRDDTWKAWLITPESTV